jgi:hypothetical protein
MARDLAKSFVVSVLPVPAGPVGAPPENQNRFIFHQGLNTSVFNLTQTLVVMYKLRGRKGRLTYLTYISHYSAAIKTELQPIK